MTLLFRLVENGEVRHVHNFYVPLCCCVHWVISSILVRRDNEQLAPRWIVNLRSYHACIAMLQQFVITRPRIRSHAPTETEWVCGERHYVYADAHLAQFPTKCQELLIFRCQETGITHGHRPGNVHEEASPGGARQCFLLTHQPGRPRSAKETPP